MLDQWSLKDPLNNFEQFLLDKKILNQNLIDAMRQEIQNQIDNGLADAFEEEEIEGDEKFELNSVFQDWNFNSVDPSTETKNMRFVDAISSGLFDFKSSVTFESDSFQSLSTNFSLFLIKGVSMRCVNSPSQA